MTDESLPENVSLWPNTYLYRQYLELKQETPAALLFMDVGAFLEAWGADAVCVAAVLGIRLTQRGTFTDGTPIPMCGIPADSRFTNGSETDLKFVGSTVPYLKALMRAGYCVAIAVQQPTKPVTRKIEWTFYPKGEWGQSEVLRPIILR